MNRKNILKILRRIYILAGILFFIWLPISFQATGFDPAILQSDALVTVTETDEALVFAPVQPAQSTGFIFYPGALVEPEAYAPMAYTLAQHQFKTTILKLPWGMAPQAAHERLLFQRTTAVMAQEPMIDTWYLGGHSRGGALAARFAHQHPTAVTGLILMGTSHPKAATTDLSAYDLEVTKIYGTQDGLASVGEVEANRKYLPATTSFISIKGGNHAQFGWYGTQLGDQRATISREDQQAKMIGAILYVLSQGHITRSFYDRR